MALDNLRAANIMWVSSLEAGLWKGENLIAKTPINSIWVKDKKKVNAIIAQREAKFDLGMLSNALSSLMNRNDLDIPLQQFFSRVNSTELDYASDALARLTELRITEDYIAEVRQKWLGDLEWTSRLCKMIVSHFTTGMDLSAFDSIESYGQLRDLVGTHEVSEIGNEEIIPFVKEFCDVRSLGWQLFEKYGESTELHKWNITIAYFGYPELKNENAKTEFASVYSSLKMLLFSIVAFSLSSGKILESFEKCRTMINMVKCPDEYSRKYWEVNFTHVAPVVVKILADIGVDQDLTAPILQAGTVDIAIKVVHEIIPDLYHDPISLHGRNKRLQHHVMQELVSYAIVWSLKSEIEFAFWEKDTEELSGRAFHDESNDMFLVQFDEGMCLSRIKEEFLERINPSFSRAIQESEKLSTLKGRLGLTEEDFKAAQTRLLEYSQRQVRLKNTVMVCGQEFYNEDNHYSDLFDLLDRNIDIKDLPEIDLDTNAPISEIAPAISGSRQSRGSFTKGRGRGRKPNALWNLIGLVGEIHAFRILQKKYGASHVTSNDWK
ncbi:MAG: hypothetical protein H8E17_16120, partial [Deltaproteobacteria bacterium]|nr:hypothetical protein [Deltaproteobacteria bacterium]